MPRSSTAGGARLVEFPTVELPGLPVASTAGLGNRIHGSRNEIWLCPAYVPGPTPVMLYVKLGLGTRAMLAEALCAQLAHALNLDTPPPYLVTVNPAHVGRTRGPLVLAFGSEDVSEHSMARPMRALDDLLQLLRRRKVADLLAVFDEWIANDVRSPSDLLVSPEGRLYLIDHEAALPDALDPGAQVTNWLATQLLEGLSNKDRTLLLRNLRARLPALMRVKLGQPPLAAQYSPDGVAIYTALLHFLRARLAQLDRLLSQRVLPEQGYLTETEPLQDPAADDAHGSG